MENQHKKIKGYRDLSQVEIDLMNRIKAHAELTRELISEVGEMREGDRTALHSNLEETCSDLRSSDLDESQRCLSLAKTNLQQGFMWLVRSVALPQSF